MPLYSFIISSGDQPQSNSTADCPDAAAAKKEAAGMFADMARDVSERLQSCPDWQIEVVDDAGRLIFSIKIKAESPH